MDGHANLRSCSQSLLKFMSIESVMSSNHLIFCHPLLLLPSVLPSIRVFSNESALGIRWPKYYWSFSFSISPSNEYSGLISFKMDWFTMRVSVKQDAVCHCASTVSQKGKPVHPFCLPSDAMLGAIVDRTGVGLGTHLSHVDSGTFLCDPGAKEKQSIALGIKTPSLDKRCSLQ